MEILDYFLILLVLSLVVLVYFLIKFLKNITESTNILVGSIQKIENDISDLKEEMMNSSRNLTHITTKVAELSNRVEDDYLTLTSVFDKIRNLNLFNSSVVKSKLETPEDNINNLISILRGVSAGVKVFFKNLK